MTNKDKSICSFGECIELATHYPQICVPPTGYPITNGNCLKSMLGLKLCQHHAKRFDVQGFLDCPTPSGTGTNRVIFEVMGRMAGSSVAPDFIRAFIRPVRLDSPEAEQYAKLTKDNNGPVEPIPTEG